MEPKNVGFEKWLKREHVTVKVIFFMYSFLLDQGLNFNKNRNIPIKW